MKGTLFVAALVLCAASVAQAGLTARVGPGEDAGNGLTRYIVYIDSDSSDPGYVCGAMEGYLLGPMNQVWVNGVTPTPDMKNAQLLTPEELAIDTHVLYDTDPITGLAPGIEVPREDGPGTGSFMRGQNWFTGELTDLMSFGFMGELRQQYLPVFQVVIPAGETVLFSGRAASNLGPIDPLGVGGENGPGLLPSEEFLATLTEDMYWYPVEVVVPEPCTIGLLLAGAGMVFARRRR